MLRAALLFLALWIGSQAAHAQGAPTSVPSATAARVKPTAAEKRCLASRRRVDRQHEAIAEADARVAKEQKAKASCKTKRACDSLDRALNASQTRHQRHAKQLAQFEGEAQKACASSSGDYRSSTATTSSPTTANVKSTK